jgi:hypothetical protein
VNFQNEWRVQHDDNAFHDADLIPMEAATVSFSGGVYTVNKSTPGISSITHPALGRIVVTLNAPGMNTSTDWVIHPYAEPVGGAAVYCFENAQAGSVKSTTVIEFRMVDWNGSYVDTGYWFGIYGARG